MEVPGTIWIALFLLIALITFEVLNPKTLNEKFSNFITPVDVSGDENNFFAKLIPRRGDVGLHLEEKNFLQDPRYFAGYVDMQKFGFSHDFCRVVEPELVDDKTSSHISIKKNIPADMARAFFACALAGTNGLPSTTYRTKSVAEGLQLSRDDYMRDIVNENRFAYCRIIPSDSGQYQPLCLRGNDTGFNDTNEVDPNPPAEIVTMVDFYDGIVGWLRFRDDMIDYTQTLTVQKAGGISIPEDPNPAATQGVSFNGVDQYLRISDATDLTLGKTIKMRSVRAFSMWVYFDAFTNNAHIFDFGDGPGNNNTTLSILGKGDATTDSNVIRPLLCGSEQNTIPDYPSGPHPCAETTPQNLMFLKANVNEFECKMFDTQPDRMSKPKKATAIIPTTASLLYEIWDSKQRKQRILVNGVIALKKWTHITITATTNDSFRPDISIYVNGIQVYVQPSGFLSQAESTSNNYLGKSNWSNQTSQYELKDELFSGKIFDFRMYNNVMSEKKIGSTIAWGKDKLGIV